MPNNNFSINNLILPFLSAILIVLLPVLAYLQYNWISELGDREKEHLKIITESSATQLIKAVNREGANIEKAFIMPDTILSFGKLENLLYDKIRNWRKTESSSLVREIYLVILNTKTESYYFNEKEKSTETSQIPTTVGISENDILKFIENYKPKQSNLILGNFEILILPFENDRNKKAAVVIKLSTQGFIESVILKYLQLYFPGYQNNKTILAFKSANEDIIYSNDISFVRDSTHEWIDVNLPVGILPSINFAEFTIKNPRDRNYTANRDSSIIILRNEQKFIESLPSFVKPMYLSVGSKDGNLESKITSFKFKNTFTSFLVLIIFTVVIFFIIFISSKAKILASRQMEFVGGISHELRTPLAVLRSAGQNLADGIVGDFSKVKSYGTLILHESNRLWDMIETTLMFAGVEAGRKVMKLERHSPKKIIDKSIENCRLLSNKNINIVNAINIFAPYVICDFNSMVAVFQNIIMNGMKFSPEKSSIEITLEKGMGKRYVGILLKDKGKGIAYKDLPHIFEPFYRGSEAVNSGVEGSGLGLFIVNKLVEVNKGKIKVDSRLNYGTIFTIQLLKAEDE